MSLLEWEILNWKSHKRYILTSYFKTFQSKQCLLTKILTIKKINHKECFKTTANTSYSERSFEEVSLQSRMKLKSYAKHELEGRN